MNLVVSERQREGLIALSRALCTIRLARPDPRKPWFPVLRYLAAHAKASSNYYAGRPRRDREGVILTIPRLIFARLAALTLGDALPSAPGPWVRQLGENAAELFARTDTRAHDVALVIIAVHVRCWRERGQAEPGDVVMMRVWNGAREWFVEGDPLCAAEEGEDRAKDHGT
jgi:hypothetical protein